ncbi:MAG: tRNA (adenosine(37)-N6)-threonylcarbamoyltransferase complex ATPase subunit type 1 TsaE [Pseudomonadota bacterium]
MTSSGTPPKLELGRGASIGAPSETHLIELGRQLSDRVAVGDIIRLNGPLGAGKTTLVRGLLWGLGHEGAVKSPTYTLLEPYDLPWGLVYHFDLYRIADPDELDLIGFAELTDGRALCLIEWPERGGHYVPETGLRIDLDVEGSGRHLRIS